MIVNIKHRVLGLAAAVLLAGSSTLAQASSLKILVGFPPGGGTDAIARVLAEKLEKPLKTSVIVDNKAGAGGLLAAQALKAAPADGSVLFLSHDHSISILPLTLKAAGFDPDQDFVPVAGFASFVNGLAVSGGTPAKTYQEYLAWVKQDVRKRGIVGVPAPASTPEFLVKVMGQQHKLDLQAAPYRGSAPMMADMLGNQIAAGTGSVPDFIENHKAGKLRVVAVIGTKRQPTLPDVPTFAELGIKGFEDLPYYGLFAPKGTPQAVIDRYASALAEVLKLPEVRERLTSMGLTVDYMTPQQLGQRERAYRAGWARIIEASGFQAQ
jgi:tripartite-type tricarboxylate transporter receptor subunit TctC